MITIYKDGDRKEVHPIDAGGWYRAGWSNQPPASEQAVAAKESPPTTPPVTPPSKLNINTATEGEIANRLPGVGNATAKKIIGDRPIKSVEQLVELLPDKDWKELGKLIAI